MVRSQLEGAAYVPFAQHYEPFATIAVRASRDAAASVVALKNLAQRLEPELGIIDAGTGTELSGVENLAFEIMGALTGLLGLAAMVLAMAGLYGVLSYVVAQRTQEIGVRVALGATTKQIARLIVMDGVRPVIEGIVVGFVVADLAEMAMRPALAEAAAGHRRLSDGPRSAAVPGRGARGVLPAVEARRRSRPQRRAAPHVM